MGHEGSKDRKELDHRNGSEYPHAFRRQWPRKKALRHRQERHAARAQLQHAADPEVAEDLVISPKERQPLRKWGATPLGEWIAGKLSVRAHRYAWNLLYKPYDPDKAERYDAMIRALCAGADHRLAEQFLCWLDAEQPVLQAILDANPALSVLLRDFIARCLGREEP